MELRQVTLNELRKILVENRLEFFIKKEKDNIVKVNFIVKEETE
jgi:hypothetical protein